MSDRFSEAGDRVERRVAITREDILRVARDLGDANPVHNDPEEAAASRFGGLIASASQTVGLLLGLLGSQARPDKPGVGLSFRFDLKSAANAGDEVLLWWEVVAARPTGSGSHTLVDVRGGITGPAGRPILEATGTTLSFGRRAVT